MNVKGMREPEVTVDVCSEHKRVGKIVVFNYKGGAQRAMNRIAIVFKQHECRAGTLKLGDSMRGVG